MAVGRDGQPPERVDVFRRDEIGEIQDAARLDIEIREVAFAPIGTGLDLPAGEDRRRNVAVRPQIEAQRPHEAEVAVVHPRKGDVHGCEFGIKPARGGNFYPDAVPARAAADRTAMSEKGERHGHGARGLPPERHAGGVPLLHGYDLRNGDNPARRAADGAEKQGAFAVGRLFAGCRRKAEHLPAAAGVQLKDAGGRARIPFVE